jgi:hypothetical protein
MTLEPKFKIIIIITVISLLIVLWTTRSVYDTNTCDPLWEDINRKLDHIKTPNSIRTIKLYKEYPDSEYKSNLVGDTVIVLDPSVIDSIRTMVSNKYLRKWNRPVGLWHVRVRMTLDNGETLDFRVSKIDNSNTPKVTHMYFGTNLCGDSGPSYSMTLGDYLEKITNYKGVNY